jgi:hypothetical protein
MKWMRSACLAALAALPVAAQGQVVISQIYGGGGNSGSTYTNDFIELFNKGNTVVDLTGWSVQYHSATTDGVWSNSGVPTVLSNPASSPSGLQPGQYYLIQESLGAGGTTALPTPDATGVIALAAGAGKVALVNNSTPLTGCVTTGFVDMVGYGPTATCFRGAPTAALSNTTAAVRNNGGCTDTHNNQADFTVLTVATFADATHTMPRNSATPVSVCAGHSAPTGIGSTSPATVCPGSSVTLFLAVTPGTNPASPVTGVTIDTSSVDNSGGVVPMYDDGTHGDVTAGDGVWTTTANVFVSGPSNHALTAVITDALNTTGTASINVSVANANPTGFVLATPSGLCSGESTLITCSSNTGCTGSAVASVTVDLSQVGGSGVQQLYDDGTHGDAVAGDGLYSFLYALPAGVPDDNHVITASVVDSGGNASNTLTTPLTTTSTCTNASSTVVISQIFGGGGNSGATLTNDFVELFNRGTMPVSLSGMSIQYASGETDTVGLGGSGRISVLPAATIEPGHYYLIQEAAGAAGTQPLPSPDFTPGAGGDAQVPIAMALNRGTIALVNGTSPLLLSGCSDPSILDMVGYGNSTGAAPDANRGFCHEGPAAPPYYWAPTLDNTTAAFRRDGGCHDVNNNAIDFYAAAPAPRNSATPAHTCGLPVCCRNDYNGDGAVGTDSDIEAFFACLSGNCCATCPPNADFNCDGGVGTDADIESFFRVLSGGQC